MNSKWINQQCVDDAITLLLNRTILSRFVVLASSLAALADFCASMRRSVTIFCKVHSLEWETDAPAIFGSCKIAQFLCTCFDATRKALLEPKAHTHYTIASVHISARVGRRCRIPLCLATVSLKIQAWRFFFSIPGFSSPEPGKESLSTQVSNV